MNRSKFIFTALTLSILFALTHISVFAQAEPKPIQPSYDVTLQVAIGTNDGAGSLPGELAGISRQLKNNFAFTNYRLADTFLGRVGNTGNLQYKSIFNIFQGRTDNQAQTFLDWSLMDLKAGKDAAGRELLQAENFRFGGRIPVTVSEEGKGPAVVNYESIGLNLQRLSMPMNTPTLVGSITMTKELGTMFVIVTVRSAS